jgi:hypothetical protein
MYVLRNTKVLTSVQEQQIIESCLIIIDTTKSGNKSISVRHNEIGKNKTRYILN